MTTKTKPVKRKKTKATVDSKKKSRKAKPLTLGDRLGRLEFKSACKLLGENGEKLISKGGKYDDIDIDKDVYIRGDLFRLTLRDSNIPNGIARVTLTLMASRQKRIVWNCDCCSNACEHVGAAFSLILEEKYSLGLSEIPQEGVPLELLREDQLVRRALAERIKRAKDEPFRLKSSNPETPWTDYLVTSVLSGKTYRVALRGSEPGESFCSCPDFRTNTLGTCKHVLYSLERVRRKFPKKQFGEPFDPSEFAVHLKYGEELSLHLQGPGALIRESKSVIGTLTDGAIQDIPSLLSCIRKLEASGHSVIIYPDAEEWISQRLFQDRMTAYVNEIRRDPQNHVLRKELLKVELLPYQLDGIAFAVGEGRAILADDMGLGKTIQAIGVAEILAQTANISRVLVVCPASVKSQWRSEIGRFSGRDVQVVLGTASERHEQYRDGAFFTICNYEQVLRDIKSIEQVKWDLIVLDEGQRIKNWAAKTSRTIKGLKSPYALVLSGTPLENRLGELFSVVQFIDDRRLSPAFRFFHRHRVVDDKGKVIGYKNLDTLRENLKPILLRRTRASVLQDLPERTTEIVRIRPTKEQKAINDENVARAARIAAKRFLTEMDFLLLQKALMMARMSCDSTFLVDKEAPGFSSKLEYLDELVEQLFAEPDRKAVLFSEWTTMLNLIEPILEKHGVEFVRMDGKVPQKKRQQLVNRFQNDPSCRLFITTNAGATGLNLQAANTIINIDLPWNPAVLEQRISRAHRMGQKRPVDVYLLVTEDTIEERLLGTLADKQNLANAALDVNSDVTEMEFHSGIEELKKRLEVLLGNVPAAPEDRTAKQQAEEEVKRFGAHRERVAAAGGEMLGAVFNFLGELISNEQRPAPPETMVNEVRNRLDQCVTEDDRGQTQLTLTLGDRSSLDQLAQTLAGLMVAGEGDRASKA